MVCTDGHSIELFSSCFCGKTRLKKPLDSAAHAEGGGGAEPASLVNTRKFTSHTSCYTLVRNTHSLKQAFRHLLSRVHKCRKETVKKEVKVD